MQVPQLVGISHHIDCGNLSVRDFQRGRLEFTVSSARPWSRLELMAAEVANQFLMSEGAAAKRSSVAVMMVSFCWFRHHDEARPASVTCAKDFCPTHVIIPTHGRS
jgi:hypothetical protein